MSLDTILLAWQSSLGILVLLIASKKMTGVDVVECLPSIHPFFPLAESILILLSFPPLTHTRTRGPEVSSNLISNANQSIPTCQPVINAGIHTHYSLGLWGVSRIF